VSGLRDIGADLGNQFEGTGASVEGDRQPVSIEDALQPPHAGAAAVLEDGFIAQIADRRRWIAEFLGWFVAAVTGPVRAFCSGFVIDDQAYRHPSVAGPADRRAAASITGEIAVGTGSVG
jgi:hypothetical protein